MVFGKKKGGWVYLGESTRKNGSKQLYTGITRRSPSTRWDEHKKASAGPSGKSWTSKGTAFKPKTAFWSRNPEKAERTIKSYSTAKKKRVIGYATSKYKKKRSW